MAEIININIGQASVRIGDQFWNTLTKEHCMHQQHKQGRMTFFQQNSQSCEARSIFIDTDQREIDKLRNKQGTLYNQNDLISKDIPTYGVFTESAYNVYPLFQEIIQQRIRKRAEACDNLTGFLLFATYGGGTASGFGAKIGGHIRQSYPDKIIQTVRLLPNLQSGNQLQIYNTILATQHEISNSDMTLTFDSISTQKIMSREGQQQSIKNINKWIASSISETTIPYRFAGSLNTSQRKIATNIVLFPRMHFLAFTMCNKFNVNPLLSATDPNNFSIDNFFSSSQHILSSYIGVRDHFRYEQQITVTANRQFERKNIRFSDWLFTKFHVGINQPVSRPSASILINSFHLSQVYKRISTSFAKIYRRRGFDAWYTGAGMDRYEFQQAESNINDLINEYQPYEYEVESDDEDYGNLSS